LLGTSCNRLVISFGPLVVAVTSLILSLSSARRILSRSALRSEKRLRRAKLWTRVVLSRPRIGKKFKQVGDLRGAWEVGHRALQPCWPRLPTRATAGAQAAFGRQPATPHWSDHRDIQTQWPQKSLTVVNMQHAMRPHQSWISNESAFAITAGPVLAGVRKGAGQVCPR
jgi:hypothetical protein